MIAKGLSHALREMAAQLTLTADNLDRLGKMWDTSDAPEITPNLAKKAKAIRKDMARKKVVRRKPHWTQTPEGKLKIAAMNAKRWAKKEDNDGQATTSTATN